MPCWTSEAREATPVDKAVEAVGEVERSRRARNSSKHGLRSTEYRGLWKQLNALALARQQLFESNNFENFSEGDDERTNQKLSELLQHGETVTFEEDV